MVSLLVLAFFLGYYLRELREILGKILERIGQVGTKLEANDESGVARTGRVIKSPSRAEKVQYIDPIESDTGGIRAPNPKRVALENAAQEAMERKRI